MLIVMTIITGTASKYTEDLQMEFESRQTEIRDRAVPYWDECSFLILLYIINTLKYQI